MKGLKKIAIVIFVVCFMTFSSIQAFAITNVADTLGTALPLYHAGMSGWDGSSSSSNLLIDSPSDKDWYEIDNGLGNPFSFMITLTPPSNITYDVQFVRMDTNGIISGPYNIGNSGPGSPVIFGTDVQRGCRVYIIVSPHSSSDYDASRPYKLEFLKLN